MKDLLKNILRATAILTALAVLSMNVYAINPFKLAESSKIVIKGTSSVHDWESDVTEIDGTGTFTVNEGKIISANDVRITVPVKSIKSGKDGMDNKTHEALKASEAPTIQFKLHDIESAENGKIKASGELTIAGVTKPVTISGDYELRGNQIVISGTQNLDMKTFDIKPPTAMFGAIKAGAGISIDYTLVFLSE